jgi:SSS family solute:Na+ symporter/sodium/pantothenate symporter
MVVVGLVAVLLNIEPVTYLQALVVFSSGGAGASFIVPSLMLCYWRRATAQGATAAMLSGASVTLILYLVGFIAGMNGFDPKIGQMTTFRPWFFCGLEPMLWGLAASTVVGIVVSLCTQPPDKSRVSLLFDAEPGT